VAVMYRGEIIERAPVKEFFRNPRQAYSRRLIAALPDLTHFNADSGGGGAAATG
jgi:ABC-type dipeptide/oligopeptide/nickel transport system ATPase component